MVDSISDVRELNRRVNDQFSVYNPTEEEFIVMWDSSQTWRFPPLKETIVPRYIAVQYTKKMTDSILGLEARAEVDALNFKRKKSGQPKLTGSEELPYERAIYLDGAKRMEIMKSLKPRLVSEFGKDVKVALPETIQPYKAAKTDDELFDDLIQITQPVSKSNTDLLVSETEEKSPIDNALLDVSE